MINAAIACLDREGESALGVNRVARELGIKPPAIYKHLDGNPALKRAVALALWQDFFAFFQPRSTGLSDSKELLKAGGRATRDYARSHIMSVELTAIKLLALTTSRNLSTHG